MSRKFFVVLAVGAVLLMVGAGWFLARGNVGPDSAAEAVTSVSSATASPTPKNEDGTPGVPGDATSTTGPSDGTAKDSSAKKKPAESFEELEIDETRTDPELVASAACDLSGDLLPKAIPSYKDGGDFRDLLVNTEERLADYRLAEGVDPRIKAALKIADRVVKNWNLALANYEAGRPAAAKRNMVRANALMKKLPKAGTGELCPENR